jgi:hypothetical protein
MDAIYTTIMKTFHDWYHHPHQNSYLPNVQIQAFNDQLQNSRRYKVYQLGNGIYQVEHLDTSIKYIMDLLKRTWECTNF